MANPRRHKLQIPIVYISFVYAQANNEVRRTTLVLNQKKKKKKEKRKIKIKTHIIIIIYYNYYVLQKIRIFDKKKGFGKRFCKFLLKDFFNIKKPC